MIELPSYDLPQPLSYRMRNIADLAFYEALFIACKRDELASMVPPEMLKTVLEQQFKAQSSGYATQFPDAHDYVILYNAAPIGRFMLQANKKRLLLVDIAIMPTSHKMGLGTKIMRMLIQHAKIQQISLELSVAKNNIIAFTFYAKLGFKVISDKDHHIKMQYSAH